MKHIQGEAFFDNIISAEADDKLKHLTDPNFDPSTVNITLPIPHQPNVMSQNIYLNISPFPPQDTYGNTTTLDPAVYGGGRKSNKMAYAR